MLGLSTPLYHVTHIAVCASPPSRRLWFLRRFGLKTCIDFLHFSLESGMVFEGTTGVYERTYLSIQFQMNKKERE